MFPLLGKEFHLNNSQLAMLPGITVITLDFANFIIVPLSNISGRRATSLVFSVLITLTCVRQALATSHKSLLAARAVNGSVCATSESIPVQMIADVFFLHERGLWMGVYLWVISIATDPNKDDEYIHHSTGYFMGAFLGPVIASFISSHHGWQSFFWLETALSGVSILLIALTFPETKFYRGDAAVRNTSTILNGSESVSIENQSQTEQSTTHTAAPDSEMSSMETAIATKGRPSRAQSKPFQKLDPQVERIHGS